MEEHIVHCGIMKSVKSLCYSTRYNSSAKMYLLKSS